MSRKRQRVMSDAMDGARAGATIGAFFAGMAIAVGAARAAVLAISGVTVRFGWDHARMLAFYAGAFVAAGALVGAVHATLRNRTATVVAFAAAGALVMNAIAIFLDWQSYDWIMAVAMSVFGAIFGLAAGYGLAGRP
jgi:hypothetical protein